MLTLTTLALTFTLAAQDAPPAATETTTIDVETAEVPVAPQRAPMRAKATTTTTMEVSEPAPPRKGVDNEFAQGATFFGGARAAVAFPPGGEGPAPMMGLELGVAAEKGLGYGLHLFGAGNTPAAPTFDLPAAPYAFGALVDMRYYLQTVEPLRLYPTLSVGFMAGPAVDTGKNAVLPLVTPGFGARVNMGPVYVSIEIGAASFYIPFMAVSAGWEPGRA